MNQPTLSLMNTNNKSFQLMQKSKDIKNKLHNLKLSKLPNVLKIYKAQSLKLKKALISFNIIVMMQPMFKLIMILKKKDHAIISVKINGSAMLINAIQTQPNKSEIELLTLSEAQSFKFQPLTSFQMFGNKIMDHALKKILPREPKATRATNHLDLNQIFHVQMDLKDLKLEAV